MGRGSAMLIAILLAATTGALLGQEGTPARQDPPTPPTTQDPTKPPDPKPESPPQPAPAQEDQIPITSVIETWMRFVQAGEHRGFTHEKISPGPHRLYRYDYMHEGDIDISLATEAGGEVEIVHWSWQVTAQLTDQFDPYKLEATSNFAGVQWKMDIRTVEDKRIIEISLPPSAEQPTGAIFRTEISVDQPLGVSGELLLYKLRQRKDLAKPGTVPYRILGSGGSEVTLQFRVEEAVLKEYGTQKAAFVTPIEVQGAPSESIIPINLRVYVDKYGRIVEALGREESMRYIIASNATEARGGEFALSARGRRDPFSKRLALTPITRGGGGGAKVNPDSILPVIPLDKVGEKLAEVGTWIEKLEQYVKSNSPLAEQTYQKFLKYYEVLRRMCIADPVRLNQLDGYKAKAEQIYGGAERLVKRAQALLEGIEDYYNALNEQGVELNIKELRELRAKKEFFQDERVVEMDRIIKGAEQKLAATRARVELAKKVIVLNGTYSEMAIFKQTATLDAVIIGAPVRVDQPIRVVHNYTYAVINNKLYREGEEVEGQGVLIEKIRPHAITISYKGEVREVGLKAYGGPARQ